MAGYINRVRLFEWANEQNQEVSLIGFPDSAVRAGEAAGEELTDYLKASGRTVHLREVPEHLAHVVKLCYEIEPPLDGKQLGRVARIALAHTSQNGIGEFIDNRGKIPERATELAGPFVFTTSPLPEAVLDDLGNFRHK
jgi:hypothetical protein